MPDDALPCVRYWGADLGELNDVELESIEVALEPPYVDSVINSAPSVSILPQHSSGWLGRPGLMGSRAGQAWSVKFDRVTHDIDDRGDVSHITSVGVDVPNQLTVTTELELQPSGLLRVRAAVRNDSDAVFEVHRIETAIPVPAQADELLDMTGRHTRERTPQRMPFNIGTWTRESWGGRAGHDSATMLCAGTAGFGFRRGDVWGVHLAHSGNQVLSAEHANNGWRLLRGGELLFPGEVRLAHGETYSSPWLVASWGNGLDELESRVHQFLRARPQHPKRPRPVLLNTWEAVYFDHDITKLLELADAAAAIGVERFVLDDGWFLNRRSDNAGLGDWFVDETIWPEGLHPIVDRVHELGMEFGLWFEPEMVNVDSDLAREHPEWIMQTVHGTGPDSRQQQVLDLTHEDAYAFILERMDALVSEYDIAYIKWDHNRPLLDAGHTPGGEAAGHQQVQCLYRLLSELKSRHPGLEIESCAGGGGRIDLGIIEYTDRIWASDCIDALERQRMQRWTSLILPPELVGTHVGSGRDHTTKRTHALRMRAGTAMWGHFGIEWDLTDATSVELDELATWIAFHKELRSLLHSGNVVHADPTNPAFLLEGVVAQDGHDALYRLASVEHTVTWPPGRMTLPGLVPDVSYRVCVQPPGDGFANSAQQPPWVRDGVTLTGRVLAEVGIQMPLMDTEDLVLIRATEA